MTDAAGQPPPDNEAPATAGDSDERSGSGGNGNPQSDSTSEPHQKKHVSSLDEIPAVAAYLKRINAKPRSMLTAVVREQGSGGYWSDAATVHLDKETGAITVRPPWGMEAAAVQEFEPTEAERAAIIEAVQAVTWPAPVTLAALPELSDCLKVAQREGRLFEFHDAEGRLCMLQARMEPEDGSPKYFEPWTYFSDGQWRKMEPGGLLPLWGAPALKNAHSAFIHEGAGPARFVAEMCKSPARLAAHPWGSQLQYSAHVGWIGGALAPHRTDWSVLSKRAVKLVYVVADRDKAGEAAIKKISRALARYQIQVIALRFDERFPPGHDLADDFPDTLFEGEGDERKYIGPSFLDCCSPATWATRIGADDRPYLRSEFKAEWHMVAGEGEAIFINSFNRSKLYSERGFNNCVRTRSDTANTADLFKTDAYEQQVDAIAYEPGDAEGVIVVEGERCINTWTAARIRPAAGDPRPWLDFLEHLIPRADDRQLVMKWIATLIARPAVRMHYGLLLASTVQGVGKTTFAEIARVLVGEKNCRSPSAHDVVESQFNSWIVRKRLVIVNEIYEGGKWNAYNKLKSKITDLTLEANEKMIRSYSIRNWAHFILCSNAEVPLWVEDDDRRFLIPEVTEQMRPDEVWKDFYAWLAGGGYTVVAYWAEEFVTAAGTVKPGEHAPDSARKRALIEDSRSSEEMMVRGLADAAKERGGQVVLVENDIVDWLHNQTGRQLKPHAVRGWLRKAGLCVSEGRVKVDGRMSRIAGVLPVDSGEGWPAFQSYRAKPDELEPM